MSLRSEIEELKEKIEYMEIEIYQLKNPDKSGAAGLVLAYIILIIIIFVK